MAIYANEHMIDLLNEQYKKVKELEDRLINEVAMIDNAAKDKIENLNNLLKQGLIEMQSVCDLKGCDFDDIHEWMNNVKKELNDN